jgi:enoyl-CoA hydratase/carnithine racemase
VLFTPQPIKDSAAKKLGLVDEVVPGGQEALLKAAKALALDIAEGRRPRLYSLYRTDKYVVYMIPVHVNTWVSRFPKSLADTMEATHLFDQGMHAMFMTTVATPDALQA